jgi:hypothetical protein
MRQKPIAFLAAFGWCLWMQTGQLARCDQSDSATPRRETESVCRDSKGRSYSPGAVVVIGDKGMECVIGPHWSPIGSARRVLDVGDGNLDAVLDARAAATDTATLASFGRDPLPILECDAVLNTAQAPRELTRVPAGERRLVLFWTPTCGACRPLLEDLVALADRRLDGLSLLGVVQSVDLELEAPGDWALLRVKQLMSKYRIAFPTCVHSSNEQMKRWHAERVPLILLLSHTGVERVAGGRNGQRFIAEVASTLTE